MTFWSELQQVGFRHGFVECGGVRTRVFEAGPERASAAAPIFMLHGVQGHLETWLRNAPRLAQAHRVVAFDLLGHGYTGKPDRPYEIADYLAHTLDLLDALGIGRATWVGSSLGGWVSARAAARHPDRVANLVLVSTAGLTADPAVMATLKTLGERASSMPGTDGVRERLRFVIHDPALVTEELVRTRWQIYSSEAYRAALEHINALQHMERRERNLLSAEELAAVRAPTLIVWTDYDPTATLETGRRYQAMIPGARFEVITGCSHIPSYERPEEFDRILLEFLQDR